MRCTRIVRGRGSPRPRAHIRGRCGRCCGRLPGSRHDRRCQPCSREYPGNTPSPRPESIGEGPPSRQPRSARTHRPQPALASVGGPYSRPSGVRGRSCPRHGQRRSRPCARGEALPRHPAMHYCDPDDGPTVLRAPALGVAAPERRHHTLRVGQVLGGFPQKPRVPPRAHRRRCSGSGSRPCRYPPVLPVAASGSAGTSSQDSTTYQRVPSRLTETVLDPAIHGPMPVEHAPPLVHGPGPRCPPAWSRSGSRLRLSGTPRCRRARHTGNADNR